MTWRMGVVAVAWIATACGEGVREEVHVYRDTPQRDVECIVHLPPGAGPDDRRALIVFFYGGGFENRRLNHFRRQADAFAEHGVVAVRADTRLVTDSDDVRAEDAIGDAQQLVSWLRGRADTFGIDPDRVVVAGGSAGGLLAASTAEVPPEDAPDLLVLFNPILEQTDPEKIARRWRSAESAAWHAPRHNVHDGMPPSLLFFGTDDPYAAPVEAYVAAARAAGVDMTLYMADGEDHGFFNAKRWRDLTIDLTFAHMKRLGLVDETPSPRSKPGAAEFFER